MDRREEKDRVDVLIGRNIRLAREACRFTREVLADMLGLTASHVGLIERGDRGATAVTLSKLSVIFDVPVDSFFSSADPEGKSVNNNAKNPQLQKLNALATCLSDKDLELLNYIAKGILYKSAETPSVSLDV